MRIAGLNQIATLAYNGYPTCPITLILIGWSRVTKMTIKKNTKNRTKVKNTVLGTVRDFICFATEQFERKHLYFGHGTDNSWDEAVYLVFHALSLSLYADQEILEKKLTAKEQRAVLKIIETRIKTRVPAAYLTAEAWFAGLPFYVDERVIIPRSPLAELIEERFVPWIKPGKVAKILDIGTGSGCIAIVCAHAFPKAKMDAVDISSEALEVATINCAKHKVKSRVKLLKSDLFEKLKGRTYDIIISNPPYVGKAEMKVLPKEYYHEPRQALCAGKDGDEIVARILQDAAKYLSPKGILVVEVGNSAAIIAQRYPHLPFVWLEFACGESEVFMLTREQLLYHMPA